MGKPPPLKLTTVTKRLKKLQKQKKLNSFTREDAKNIGAMVINRWRQRHQQDPPKQPEKQGEQSYQVFAYPSGFVKIMDKMIFLYFEQRVAANGTATI